MCPPDACAFRVFGPDAKIYIAIVESRPIRPVSHVAEMKHGFGCRKQPCLRHGRALLRFPIRPTPSVREPMRNLGPQHETRFWVWVAEVDRWWLAETACGVCDLSSRGRKQPSVFETRQGARGISNATNAVEFWAYWGRCIQQTIILESIFRPTERRGVRVEYTHGMYQP